MQEGLLGMTVSEVPHVGPLCPRGKMLDCVLITLLFSFHINFGCLPIFMKYNLNLTI